MLKQRIERFIDFNINVQSLLKLSDDRDYLFGEEGLHY